MYRRRNVDLEQRKYTPRRKKRRKIWPWVLLFCAFVAAAVAGALFASSSLVDNKLTTEGEQEGMLVAKDKTTVMIMGVDERDGDVGRSDTLMVATLDPKKHQAALLSIPRDTRVKIKGFGYDKINAAYAYGGRRLTQSTVEKFLGVPMEHYIVINVKAFQRIIDAIGGIDIDVEKRMYYEDPWDDDGGLVIDLYPGQQHMDGKTAITYVRYRDEEGDIGRIARQQKFMKAVMEKVTSPAIILDLPTIISEVINSVETDLSLIQLMQFAGSLKEAQANGLNTDMVPGRPLYIDDISYWIPNIEKLRTILANNLGITMSNSARTAMEQETREYENSIPANAKAADDSSIGSKASYDKAKAKSEAKDKLKKMKSATEKDSSSTSRENTSTSRENTKDTGTTGTSEKASESITPKTSRPSAPAPTPSPALGEPAKTQ